MTVSVIEHSIVIGRRIMFARLVSCDCGWVGGFRYGHRQQQRAARSHVESPPKGDICGRRAR